MTDSIGIFALLSCIVAFGIWMEGKPKIGQYGIILIIFLPALLAFTGILTRSSPVYPFIVNYFVPLSIPLLLFSANIRLIVQQAGQMLIAFMLSIGITITSAVAGILFLEMSTEAEVWSSIATASFIGGSANTVAVADAFGRAGDPEMAIVIASVTAVALVFMALLLSLPSIPFLWRLFLPQPKKDYPTGAQESVTQEPATNAISISTAIAFSAVIVFLGNSAVLLVGSSSAKYIAITGLSLIVATFLPNAPKRLSGHFSIGQLLIYMFFASLGTQIDFSLIRGLGVEVMLFSTFVCTSHLVLLIVLGRVFRLSGPILVLASNACILGPATAAAMAVSRQWKDLVTPAILCGVLGYALANFIGVTLTSWIL